MGNLDFLEKKPNNVTVTVQIELDELGNLASDASNCLPALSIKTLYSKIGQTANSAADSSGANKDCAVRVSSNVDFTPTSNGKIYEYGDMSSPKTTDFNAIKFTDGVVYLYSTKNDMNIGSAGAPPPCIVVPKSFTDSDSSAVFEKGIYFGYGISSGKQGYYVKYEISYERVSINISGKGFTSPQKPYRYVSNSIQSDDIIAIWVDMLRYSENDDYVNLISVPGDFNQEYNIELDDKLADLCKHIAVNKVDLMIRDGDDIYSERHDSYTLPCKLSCTMSPKNGFEISDVVIGVIYRNKSITLDMIADFEVKYMYSEP